MEEMITYLYNLNVQAIEVKEDIYEIKSDNKFFLLCPCFRSPKELEDIYQVCEELKKFQLPIHTFVLNRENKIVSTIHEREYILFKTEEMPEKEYNIIDMNHLMNQLRLTKVKSNLYRNQWTELWSQKIDYFEYQIHELGKDKKVILNSFTYYIGLAENAISYASNTLEKYKEMDYNMISLCHKRIKFPNLSKDYLNPSMFIFDLKVRDIAEYIKSAFFVNEEEAWIEVKTFLKTNRLSIFEYQMFYARLLYPSYYFDIYEKVMNKSAKEEELLPYIKKASNYEAFLKKIFLEISKFANIESIEWITNKKVL